MNMFWLKLAAVAVVVLGSIIAVSAFWPSGGEPEGEPKPRTVYEVWEKDEKELRAGAEPAAPETAVVEKPSPPEPAEDVGRVEPKPEFRELGIEDKIEAERLFEMALFHRKQGRLPGMSYKKMVDYCRQIIQRWPDSEYAFKAKRMLGDIPERYRKLYNITEEEIDLGSWK